MRKKGATDSLEFIIRLIQIIAVIAAGYLIFKALGGIS
jgi:hypothetical protein